MLRIQHFGEKSVGFDALHLEWLGAIAQYVPRKGRLLALSERSRVVFTFSVASRNSC